MKAYRYIMNKQHTEALLVLTIAFALIGGKQSSAFPLTPSDEDGKQMGQFELAEKSGDRSLDTTMIAVLQQKPAANPAVINAAAHALARLADTDALPAFDVAISSKDISSSLVIFLQVQKARLQAENRGKQMPEGDAKARAKVAAFLQALNLTPEKINSDVAEHKKTHTYPEPPEPVGSQSMTEMADMIYHGTYKDYVALPAIQQINFKEDSYTSLLMRLAALPRKDRIAAMVKDLSDDKVKNTDLEMRLAADEGSAAGEEAIAQLARMDQKRASYSRKNYTTLFTLISYTKPPEADAVKQRYGSDAELAEDAQTYLGH